MLAPEPRLSACLHVLYRATVIARSVTWGEGSHEQVAALMDAVHNIPELIRNWERCDETLLLAMLGEYDRAWGGDLRTEYERIAGG